MASSAGAQGVRRNPEVITADVTGFRITPDSTRVVYRADHSSDEVFELFQVPLTGGPSVRLSPRPVAGGDVGTFEPTPDGQRVVFTGDLAQDGVLELWSAATTGGGLARLGPPLGAGEAVVRWIVSPDSKQVVLVVSTVTGPALWSVPSTGGTAVRLDLPLTASGHVAGLRIAPRGDRVIALATLAGFGTLAQHFALWSLPLDGRPGVELAIPTAPSGYTVPTEQVFAVTHDMVVALTSPLAEARLFSVPIEGGAATELGRTDLDGVRGFEVTRDEHEVLYIGQGSTFERDVHRVAIGGGPSTTVNAPLAHGEFVAFFELTADGERVVWWTTRGDHFLAGYSMPLGGGPQTEVFSPDGAIINPRTLSDSARVLVAWIDGGALNLSSIPVVGGAPVFVAGEADLWGTFRVAPDAGHVVFTQLDLSSLTYRLHSAPTAGGGPTPLGPPPVPGGSVLEARIAPDSTRVVYRADLEHDELVALYVVPITGGEALRLSPARAAWR